MDDIKLQYEKRDEVCPEGLVEFWGKCVIYKTEQEVMQGAHQMYHEIMRSEFPIVEYGIQIIRVYKDKNFPGVV